MADFKGAARLQRYLAEFIGTYMLVFVGTGLIIINSRPGGLVTHLGISIGFGLTVMFVVYAIGHISGAHINPAVTLAFGAARRFPAADIIPYCLAQIGAILASTALLALFEKTADLGITSPSFGVGLSLAVEILIGFVLMFVITSVATDARAVGEAAAIAIGATITTLVLFAGPVSGASLNPARSIGPAVVSGKIEYLWIYVRGPIAGCLLGAAAYHLLRRPNNGQPAA